MWRLMMIKIRNEVTMVLPAKRSYPTSCHKCGRIIGQVIVVDDEELVQIGGLVVSEIDGNCATCGEEYHYSLNARRLERLIRRATEKK